MTNWGAHSLDIARWALDAVAPTAVAGFGGRYELKDGGETPDVQEVLFSFPGCLVSWAGREINGVEAIRPLPPVQTQGYRPLLEFHGTKGNMVLTRERFDVTPEVWTGYGQDSKSAAMQPISATGSNLGRDHARNFLDCVKSRKKPNADVEEGYRTVVMCHLGNIATRVGRTLRWDSDKEEIIDDKQANEFLSRPYRKPWALES
jgi:predicted dehydrogenase